MPSETAAAAKRPVPTAGLFSAIAALPRWAILLIAATAVRALTFGNPVVHVDEEFYFVTARAMLDGALPYVDIWDRKPIGLFLLYIPAALFGVPAGIWAYQMMALASVVATALLLARLAERVGWGRAGTWISLLYIFIINFGDGQGGQAPVFYNVLVALAVALLVPRAGETADDRSRIHRGMAAMALIGVALQIKYSVLFEGLFLGLWLLWREWRLGTSWAHIVRRGLAYAGMAAIPTLLAWCAYIGLGHGEAWFYANFGSILDRQSDPGRILAIAAFKIALMLVPLLIVSFLSSRMPSQSDDERITRTLYFGWLISAVIGLIVFGSWFNHYALPVMAPGSLCCAGFMARNRFGWRVLAPLMPFLALTGGEYTAWSAKWYRGNAQQLEALADLIGRGPGCLYVQSGNTILYAYSGRCRVTRWIFPSHLTRDRENGAIGADQITEVRRIFAANPPEIVVMRPEYTGERLAVRRFIEGEMSRLGYSLRGTSMLGNLPIRVYALPAERSTEPARLAASRPS